MDYIVNADSPVLPVTARWEANGHSALDQAA